MIVSTPQETIRFQDLLGDGQQFGAKLTKVIPATTAEYSLSKLVRPFISKLDKRKLGENSFQPLPIWQDAVGQFLKEAQL